MLHLDIMDGHFVPNLSIGIPVVAAVRRITDMFLDVHLMLSNPIDYIDAFVKAGADGITVHVECDSDVGQCIEAIRAHGKKAVVALNPRTDVTRALSYLDSVDMVLQMTVQPGFGGQPIVVEALHNLEILRQYPIDIQVDGGVYAHNIGEIAARGANVFVAGTAVFGEAQRADAIATLRKGASV